MQVEAGHWRNAVESDYNKMDFQVSVLAQTGGSILKWAVHIVHHNLVFIINMINTSISIYDNHEDCHNSSLLNN